MTWIRTKAFGPLLLAFSYVDVQCTLAGPSVHQASSAPQWLPIPIQTKARWSVSSLWVCHARTCSCFLSSSRAEWRESSMEQSVNMALWLWMNGQTICPPVVHLPGHKADVLASIISVTPHFFLSLTTFFPRTGITNSWMSELQPHAILFSIRSFSVNLRLVMPPAQMSNCLTMSASLLQH